MPSAGFARIVAATYWMVAVGLAFAAGQAARVPEGLRATAFDTPSFEGRRVVTRLDASLGNELLARAPFPDWSTYSVEWTGFLAIDEAAEYTFVTRADDGATLEIDGEMVVDNGGHHTAREARGSRRLESGLHPIRLRYVQAGDRYTLTVLWAPPGRALAAIPAGRLVPDAAAAAAYPLRTGRPLAAFLGVLVVCWAAFHWGWSRVSASARRPWPAAARLTDALARPGVALATVLVAGLAARLAVLATTPPVWWPDSFVFQQTVREILEGRWASHDAYRTLLYPYLLVPFVALSTSPSVGIAIVAVQQLFGLAAAVLFYVVARRAVSPLAAWAGALLFALHPLQLFYEASLLTEAFFTVTLALTLWLAVRAHETPTAARMGLLGLAAAALVLVRPVALWYLACLVVAGLVAHPHPRRAAGAWAVLALCYALPLLAWMGVNQREYGFFGVALGRGMGLYTRVFQIDGLEPPQPSADPEMRVLWAEARNRQWSANRVRDELNYGWRLSSARSDDRMFAFALETVRAQPGAYAWGTARQWVAQVADPLSGVHACQSPAGQVLCSGRREDSAPPFPVWRGPVVDRLRQAVVAAVTSAQIPMAPVLALALTGLAALVRARRGDASVALLALTFAYFTIVPAATQVPQDRFRLPVDAVLFLLAAEGALELGDAAAARAERRGPARTSRAA